MGDFLETRWSLIERASQGRSDALGEVYRNYWDPLLAYARFELNVDPEHAEELVQDFFAKVIGGAKVLKYADRRKGKFHTYLKTSFRNFVYQVWRRRGRRKRSFGRAVALDGIEDRIAGSEEATPGRAFEKTWALQILGRAMYCWKTECLEKDPRRWQLYELRVLAPVLDGTRPPPYAEIFRPLGYQSPKEAMNALTHANRAVRRHVRSVIRARITRGIDADEIIRARAAEIVQEAKHKDLRTARLEAQRSLERKTEEAVEEEIQDLMKILGQRRSRPGKRRTRYVVRDKKADLTRAVEAPSRPEPDGPDSPMVSRMPKEPGSMREFFSVYMTPDAVGGVPADAGQDEGSASWAAFVLPNPEQCDLHRLAEVLLDRDRQRPRSESRSEARSEGRGRFARMFANELSQPVRLLFDCPEIPEANDFRNLAQSYGLIGKRLGELLHHPRPPVKLLEMAKQFARARRERREDPLPGEVATVLYFVWIAAALVRCRRRITGLGDDQVQEGIRWSLDQSWVDQKTCELLHAGLSWLEKTSPVPR